MLWFTVIAALLVLQSAEGGLWFRREMTTTPLVDMTGTEVKELSAAIVSEFNKAKITCPEPARATLAFGLMTPKIAVSVPYIRQMVFASITSPPASVQEQVAKIVVDDVMANYIRPMVAMPEFAKLVEGLGDMCSKVDNFVNKVVKSAASPADVTGKVVIEQIVGMVESLKPITCDKMVTVDQLKPFINKVFAMFKIEGEVTVDEKLIDSVKEKVDKVVTDKDVASKVMAEVVAVTKVIIRDMRDTVVAMVKVLPDQLPADIFVRNLVAFYHPKTVAPAKIETVKISAAGIEFPTKKDACYEQKLAAYYTVLLRMVSTMRIKKVGVLVMSHVKDTAVHKPLFEVIKDAIKEKYEQQNLASDVKPMMDSWWKLRSSMIDMKKAGKLNEKTIVEPVNAVLKAIGTNKICKVPQATIVSVVASALDAYKRTIETDAVVNYLKGKVAEKEMAEFKKVYEPVAKEVKAVFNAILADFHANAFSVKPVNAIIKLEMYDVDKPVRQGRGVYVDVDVLNAPVQHMFQPDIMAPIAQIPIVNAAAGMKTPWDVSMVEKVVDDVQEVVDTVGAGVAVNGEEGLQRLLAVYGGVPIETVPSDVIMKIVIAVARDIQRQVPVQCRLPLRVKFIAALMRLHHGIIVAQPDRFLPLLTPIIQSLNPASPVTMETIKEVISIFSNQIHIASTAAAAHLGIYKGTEPVVMILKSIIKEVGPGMTISAIYRNILPRVTALINDVTMCDDMTLESVVQEYNAYMDRLLASPALSRPILERSLSGIIPVDIRPVVLNALTTGALPVLKRDVREFVETMSGALSNDQYFPEFYTHLIADVFPFTHPARVPSAYVPGVFQMKNVVESPVYKHFLQELKMHFRLVARLPPLSDLPEAIIDERVNEAYLTALRILGIQI